MRAAPASDAGVSSPGGSQSVDILPRRGKTRSVSPAHAFGALHPPGPRLDYSPVV